MTINTIITNRRGIHLGIPLRSRGSRVVIGRGGYCGGLGGPATSHQLPATSKKRLRRRGRWHGGPEGKTCRPVAPLPAPPDSPLRGERRSTGVERCRGQATSSSTSERPAGSSKTGDMGIGGYPASPSTTFTH